VFSVVVDIDDFEFGCGVVCFGVIFVIE